MDQSVGTTSGSDQFSERLAAAREKAGRDAARARGEEVSTQQERGVPAETSPSKPEKAEFETAEPAGAGEHIVKEGECISSIAKEVGHLWKTIWDDPANAELKAARRDPNVLLPGDRLTIPPPRPKQESGQTEMRHRFKRRGEPCMLRLRVWADDEPRGNESFVLIVDDKDEHTGTTDANGCLEVSISGDARKGHLKVGQGEDQVEYQLKLGHTAPANDVKGIQQRLTNLGYGCGPIDGILRPKTEGALRQFQNKVGLADTGKPDSATQERLKEQHGS